MSIETQSPSTTIDDRFAERRVLLEQRFNARVQFFSGPDWVGEDAEQALDLETLNAVWRTESPRLDGADSLYIPFDDNGGPLIVHCEGAFVDAHLTLELAKSTQREASNSNQLDSYQSEMEYFARQVTVDFEELTFLRRIPEILRFSKATRGLLEVAQTLLQSLGELIDAEGIVLVPASESSPFQEVRDHLNQQRPANSNQWVGKPLLDQCQVASLIERYHDQAVQMPFVQNHFQRTTGGAQFPGLHEFIIVPVGRADQVKGWLIAVNRRTSHPDWRSTATEWELIDLEYGTIEATLLASTGGILATHASNVEHFREKEELLTRIVRVMVSAIEAKDKYTCGHSERVALYGRCLAKAMGYGDESCERLYLTGLLHDVGKIGVSDSILTKPDRLTDDEFDEIKKHPDLGWSILNDLDQLSYVLPGVLFHHERVDGRGYPDALAGEQIPWDGRILAVADAYDAMTSDRPYRKGMPQEKAESILRDGAGTQWDPTVINALFGIMPAIVEIRETYQPNPDRVRDPAECREMVSALLESSEDLVANF